MAEIVYGQAAGLKARRSGKGRPLVLLHGWAMSGAVFSELLEVPPAGLELIALDLPGHGGSDACEEDSLVAWAGRVEAALRELRLPGCALLGWSLGGMLAMQVAARGLVEVERLLLVASTPRFTAGNGWQGGLPMVQLRAMQRDLQKQFRPTLENFYRLMFAVEEIPRERYRQIARFAAGPELLPRQESAAAGLRILQHSDLRPLLGRIHLPVLVLQGDGDQVVPVAAGRMLARQLADARLEVFPGCGHAPFLTRPEIFSRLVGDFCA